MTILSYLKLRLHLILTLSFLLVFLNSGLHAEEKEALTEDTVLEMAQIQFEQMYDKALSESRSELKEDGAVFPFAVALGRDTDPKAIHLKKGQVPNAETALMILRRSLQAMFVKGKVGATTIIYTAVGGESGAERVLVMEMEHIFGPSLTQVTPYLIDNGEVKFGETVVQKSDKKIFKGQKKDPVGQS